jgi:hypothetical protein
LRCRTRSSPSWCAVYVELIAAESRRTAHEPVGRLDAIDHALRGWAAWNQRRSREVAWQARASFEAALHLDGSNISALLGLADGHIWEVNSLVSDDRPGQIRAAEAAVTKALELARAAPLRIWVTRGCCSQ